MIAQEKIVIGFLVQTNQCVQYLQTVGAFVDIIAEKENLIFTGDGEFI